MSKNTFFFSITFVREIFFFTIAKFIRTQNDTTDTYYWSLLVTLVTSCYTWQLLVTTAIYWPLLVTPGTSMW